MSQTSDFEENLILLVHNHPAIYDTSHKDYKDRRGVVSNIWQSIYSDLVQLGFADKVKGV